MWEISPEYDLELNVVVGQDASVDAPTIARRVGRNCTHMTAACWPDFVLGPHLHSILPTYQLRICMDVLKDLSLLIWPRGGHLKSVMTSLHGDLEKSYALAKTVLESTSLSAAGSMPNDLPRGSEERVGHQPATVILCYGTRTVIFDCKDPSSCQLCAKFEDLLADRPSLTI